MQLTLLEEALAESEAKTLPENPMPHEMPHEEEKAASAFKTISEVASALNVPQHVLRFWESRFSQIKPLKLRGGRRYYRPEDIEILTTIQHLLYKQGYTIKGAKKAFAKTDTEALPPLAAKVKAAFTDKQYNQLAVIRQELMGMREVLKPYISKVK